MRIDRLLVTTPLRHRVVWAEIDHEARWENRYPRITHRWLSTSTTLAIRSTPVGLQRIRELRRADLRGAPLFSPKLKPFTLLKTSEVRGKGWIVVGLC